MPRRIPDPETALRVAADEVFLAGLRGERVVDIESYPSNGDGDQDRFGRHWCAFVGTDTADEHGITIIAWRTS